MSDIMPPMPPLSKVGQPQAWPQAVAAVRRGGTVVLFGGLLTHTCPLERVARPLAQAAGLTDPGDRLLKAVIRP